MQAERQQLIRALFDDYIERYAARDEGLTRCFSDNFSGFTGSGDFLVKNREDWIRVTRQDFAQVPGRIGIEMLDLAQQDLGDDVVLVTAFFHIHLPLAEHLLARETARLVLVFRREAADWKIAHSSISIPFQKAHDGEVYPISTLHERNQELAALVEERTRELEEINRKLEDLSNTDGMTGIANRRHFDRMLAQEWDRGLRTGTPLALIMLDVDHFKHYNDCYGHVAGDECLRALAQAMAGAGRRAGELAARYGGEEFVVLLPNTSAPDAMETARHLQQQLRLLALPHADMRPGIVTVSLGVASLVPSAAYLPQYLVRQADLALYRAKQSGRDCVQLASG